MARQNGFLIAATGITACAIALGDMPVSAAEGFVCGPDRIVYVEAHELEEKKRTDPCVAAFFGLTVETPVAPTPAASVAKPAATSTSSRAPATPKPAAAQPVRKLPEQPARNEAPVQAPVVKATVSLKPLSGELVQRAGKPRIGEQAALALPATTSPGTDYRRVRVINAQSADTAWFHHDR